MANSDRNHCYDIDTLASNMTGFGNSNIGYKGMENRIVYK